MAHHNSSQLLPVLAAMIAALSSPAIRADAPDDTVTVNGVTLYGTIDIGAAYQTHGTPPNAYFGPGLEYLLQKNSNKPNFSVADNGLSQSNIGIKGIEDIGGGVSALFKLDTQFNPASGNVADHLRAMTQNNGVPLAQQSTNADSSRAGQTFQNAFIGLVSDQWGMLTIGRQNSLVLDNVLAYDPMGGSQAFSLIGFSGVTGGGGDTEDTRLDNTIKYRGKYGPLRVQGLAQFDNAHGNVPSAGQIGFGADWGGLSIDGLYSSIKDAVASAPLATVPAGYSSTNALAGTISDNTALSLMAKYGYGPATLFGGYEHMDYGNPRNPLLPGTNTIGGYVLATVTNTAYTNEKILQVFWAGIKYSITPKLSATLASYEYIQNSYNSISCSTSISGKCRGSENSSSLMADYYFSKHFDVYGGAMYTHVLDGLSNGFLHTNTLSPMAGMRVRF